MIHNERTKLLANALDRASTACFTVGIATPLAEYIYNISNLRENLSVWLMFIAALGWCIACFARHYLARRVLGGLR